MAIAYTTNFATADGVASLAYPNAMASAGFLVAVIRRGGASSQPSAVSDDRNGSWTKALEVANTDHTLGLWYRENGGSGSAVTVSQTGGGGSNRWIIGEFTGLATSSSLDKTASASADSDATTFDSSATATTTQAEELFVGGAAVNGSTAFAAGGSGSWTEVDEISSKAQMQYQIASATGTPNSAPTGTANNWTAVIATFKGASAGGRTTKNTRAFPLGMGIGMHWVEPGCES